MRLVLFDCPAGRRWCFYPLALSRPIWELRCGMTSLGEKLVAKQWRLSGDHSGAAVAGVVGGESRGYSRMDWGACSAR